MMDSKIEECLTTPVLIIVWPKQQIIIDSNLCFRPNSAYPMIFRFDDVYFHFNQAAAAIFELDNEIARSIVWIWEPEASPNRAQQSSRAAAIAGTDLVEIIVAIIVGIARNHFYSRAENHGANLIFVCVPPSDCYFQSILFTNVVFVADRFAPAN